MAFLANLTTSVYGFIAHALFEAYQQRKAEEQKKKQEFLRKHEEWMTALTRKRYYTINPVVETFVNSRMPALLNHVPEQRPARPNTAPSQILSKNILQYTGLCLETAVNE